MIRDAKRISMWSIYIVLVLVGAFTYEAIDIRGFSSEFHIREKSQLNQETEYVLLYIGRHEDYIPREIDSSTELNEMKMKLDSFRRAESLWMNLLRHYKESPKRDVVVTDFGNEKAEMIDQYKAVVQNSESYW